MAFDVSATMTMSVPAPLVMAICDFAALNSSRAERLSNSAEYQPPTKAQAKLRELVLQRRAVARQLVALLHADDARLLRLGETGFQRRVAADFLQVVVAPADRIGADANAHG